MQQVEQLPGNIHRIIGTSGKTRGRMKRQPFMDFASRSKVMVCADGWGPVSHRDFESVFLGCVLIKPKTIHNESDFRCYTWPDPVDFGQVVFCSPDFSDLPAKVDEALALFEDTVDEREDAANRFRSLKLDEFFLRLRNALEPLNPEKKTKPEKPPMFL
jgi:hypothetical protein